MESKKVLIMHHNDRDGYVSAAIIANHLKDDYVQNQYKPDFIRFITMDYSKSIREYFEDARYMYGYPDEVYIVDYSASNVQALRDIQSINKEVTKLVWIDHHISSNQTIQNHKCEEFKDIPSIPGLRIDGISAAALCWLWCNTYNFDHTQSDFYLFLCKYDQQIRPLAYDRKGIRYHLQHTFDIPWFILLTHRYDIFDMGEGESCDEMLAFNLAAQCNSVEDAFKYLTYDDEYIDILLKQGFSILDYKKVYNERLMKNNAKGYSMKFKWDEKDNEENKLYFLALNHTELSSTVFDNVIDQYDFVMIYYTDGIKWKHSVYTVQDDIDVSQIAKLFGGGGHKKAAGFILDKPFYQEKPDWFTMK
ncbi:MAG: DHH family phosphoesterase [Candidatus Izemoplasmatales bacterium]|nr:DHH family phosphoesterase [Candidatus Izemoplasmatales bacterium]